VNHTNEEHPLSDEVTMGKRFRIGVVGLTHDHVWGVLENLVALEDGHLAAVADPHQPLLDKVKEKHGCACYLGHEEMAAREELDAAFVFTDNAQGAEVAVWAAQRGLHVMVEKPMAATLAGAERMIVAAQAAGVRLMVNWPVVWRPQVQAALDIAGRPEFGTIWQLTHRAAHSGPDVECSPYFREWILDPQRNGAGALVDLCCYGINMAQVLLGNPQRVTAIVGQLQRPDFVVEDNAIVVMSYPRAMATAEGAWGQIGHPVAGYLATIWGTRASVTFGPGRGGRIWTTAEGQENVEVTPAQPARHMASGAAHFVWALATGNEFHPLCRAETCRNTQEVLEAALLSSRSGAAVSLPLQTAGSNGRA
jgi:predicted dehydrogenase